MNRLFAFLENHRWAILITFIYCVLATAYNLSDPLFEAPDERLHYEYIAYLQETDRLPVVDLEGPLTEYHQPPLYYVIASAFSSRIQIDNLVEYTQPNPFWAYEIGQVGNDNKNQYLHPPESFPFTRTRQVIHRIRALSLVFGSVTIWMTYQLACRFLSKTLALSTMAVAAFVPNFLLTSGAITNDSLVIAISAVSILLIIDFLGDQEPPLASWMILAVLLALGMLTKLSFWPTLPISALAAILVALRFRSWRIFFVAGGLLLGTVTLLGLWWVLRNWRLYGDFTGLSSMWAVWGVRTPLTWKDYTVEFQNFRTTFWANFGYGNVPMPSWVYTLLDVISLGGVVGILVRVVRLVRTRYTPDVVLRDRLIVLVTWALLTVAALIWYLQKTIAVTGRQVFPILPGIALSLVVGWATFFPRRDRVIAFGIAGGMVLLATGALIGVLIPSYALPVRIPAGFESERIQFPVNWELGNTITLRGYSLATESANPGEVVQLTLVWEPHGPTSQSYTAFVHLFDQEGRPIGSRNTYPGLGNYPTIYWNLGEIVEDRIPVPISPDIDGPYLAEIEVGLYDLTTGERLRIIDSAGNTIGYPVIGHIKINQTRQIQEPPQYDLHVAFEQGIQLAGYSFSSETPVPGDELIVSLYWNPTQRPSNNYTVFVQLLNSGDQIVGQGDGIPQDGHYPTSAWGPGEYFADHHRVLLPAEVPPGNYHIRIGLYDPVSGIRLLQEDGRDFVDLPHSITIP